MKLLINLTEILQYGALFAIFGSIILGVAWIVFQSEKLNRFRKRMRPGDICIIYIDNDRVPARVIKIEGDQVIVTHNGKVYIRRIDEVYI
jgi:hypothetical protein